MAKRDALRERRDRALAGLPDLAEILRGSLRRRFVRCGKKGCHCQHGRGHGPVFYLSTSEADGQTRQITIPTETYALAKRYVDNYERAWRVLEQVCALNRELIRERLMPDDGAEPSSSRRTKRPGRSKDRR